MLVKICNAPFLAVVMLLLFAALSGCIGGGSEGSLESEAGPSSSLEMPQRGSSEPAPEPKPTSELGAIKGQVVDDGFDYVVGALVTVTNDTGPVAEAFTDKEGKYTINDLVPGVYGIRFEADCCETFTDRVMVVAGDVRSASPVLEVWSDMREPYASQLYEYNGYISCDGAWLIGFGCNMDPNHNSTHRFTVDRGIKSLVVALDWNSGFNLRDCLYLVITMPFTPYENDEFEWPADLADSEFCHEGPIELRLDAGSIWQDNMYHYDFDNITDWMPIQFEVQAHGKFDDWEGDLFNVVVQHPFTIYWKEFYWEYASEDASALPANQ